MTAEDWIMGVVLGPLPAPGQESMTREQAWWVMLPIAGWFWVLSILLDRRWSRWAMSRAEEGPAATRRMLRWSELRRLALWLPVWVLGIALAKEDPNNLEASVVVVPMVLGFGPRAFWRVWNLPSYLVEKGADPEIAKATRAGVPLAVVFLFLCVAALGVTFGG